MYTLMHKDRAGTSYRTFEEIYEVWRKIYPGDRMHRWILYPGGSRDAYAAANPVAVCEPRTKSRSR